jgi:ATP diphosphatase
MFTLVNLSRHLKIDSETSLRKANEKFETRFRALEKKVAGNGDSLQCITLDELEECWQEVKKTV